MSEQHDPKWEAFVRQTAQAFQYPETPDIRTIPETRPTRPHRVRRVLAYAAVFLVMLSCGLLAVPEIRAAVFSVLRIGAITLFMDEPTPTLTPTAAASPQPTDSEIAVTITRRPLPTPRPTPTTTVLESILDLPGEMTLENARERLSFELVLPTYPSDLGLPDRVFFTASPEYVTFVWLAENSTDTPKLSLQIIKSGGFAKKWIESEPPRVTMVGEDIGYWLDQPHDQFIYPGNTTLFRHITQPALIWADSTLTYRLEGVDTMDEAVKIAESLRPMTR